MINTIQVLLQGEKWNLQRCGNRILLFEENPINYPEDYIQIENEAGKFIVSEVHRDIKQIKAKTEKEEEAGIYATVVYKRLFDNLIDRTKVNNIRISLEAGGEEKKVLDSITNDFDDSVFSIDSEDNLKISLIHSGNKVSIKFGGEYLVEDVSLSRGYVALYNYCTKLRHISLFYNEMRKKLDCTINRQIIVKMYILGK